MPLSSSQRPPALRRARTALVALVAGAALAAAGSASAGSVVWVKNPSSESPPTFDAGEIWIADEDGSNARLLLRPNGMLPGIPKPFMATRLGSPQLSDDGRTLTFTATWNRLWFRGAATSCGLFCEGVYRLRNGVITRVSPKIPNAPLNGCAGAAATDLCQSFEGDAVQVGDAVAFSDVSYYWVNCGASGCGSVSNFDYNAIRLYKPRAGGGFARDSVLDWRNDCPGGTSEPQNTSFAGNANGFIFSGCVGNQGSPISVAADDGSQVDLGRFYVPPMSISLAPDASRVLATASRPGSNDPDAVWSFPIVQGGADALAPQDYLIAIFNDDARALSAHDAVLARTSLWSSASDGNIYRWPSGCGVSISCTFAANGARVTRDAGGRFVQAGTGGYWDHFKVFNAEPRWSAATTVRLGASGRPKVGTLFAWCAASGARCPLRLTWVANKPGTVRLTVKPQGRPAFTVRAATTAGPGSTTLPARALPRRVPYRITATLTGAGGTSAVARATVVVR